MKKSMTFEQAMNRLEEIARELESGDVPLEDSIKMYEEGIQLIEFCQKKLDEAELKVRKLTRNASGDFETTPLPETDNSSSSQ